MGNTEILTELEKALDEIENQITELKRYVEFINDELPSDIPKMSVYQYQYSNGQHALIPLIVARAQILQAIAFMKPQVIVHNNPDLDADRLPHSRACGIRPHPHGRSCSSNCQTCHGTSGYFDGVLGWVPTS